MVDLVYIIKFLVWVSIKVLFCIQSIYLIALSRVCWTTELLKL